MIAIKCWALASEFLHKCQLRDCFHVYRKLLYYQMQNDNTIHHAAKWSNINWRLYVHRLLPPRRHLQQMTFVRCLCTASDKKALLTEKRDAVKKEFIAYIDQNKEKLRDTEQRIILRGSTILKDIKETRDKVKGRVEEVIQKENIYTIPNFLCVARMVMSPYLGLLIVQADFNYALGLLGIAAFTDLVLQHGWIARTWESQSSNIGSFLDPMADKIMIATLFLSLTYADLIPIALTGLIVARDVVLVVAGFVIRYQSLPPPKTFSRYFDATHATAQLAPTFISKVNTVVQLVLVGSTLAAPVFHYVGHPALESLWYITAGTTIAAGLSYVLSRNTYKFLENHKRLRNKHKQQ